MNLLSKKTETADINNQSFNVGSFRTAQYNLINYFMNLCIEYISKQNKNYLTVHKINIYDITTYVSINNNFMTHVSVDVNVNGPTGVETKTFLKFLIPTLINETFFVLSGNYYVPTIYILDKPIVIKDKSIKLTSTFNSITIYDKLITFMGTNIPAIYFLNLFLLDSDPAQAATKNEFVQTFKINQIQITDQDLLNYFSNLFKCDPKRDEIQKRFTNIFFDDYSKLLYQHCYNLTESDLTFPNLLRIAIDLEKNMLDDTFIDLNQKRLLFIEILLWPIFKRIANVATQASKGYTVSEITMDQMELVKNFYTKLHNKFIYDNVNAYDTMLSHKACMLNPNAKNAPGVVANLHPTHFQRICPTSVSSQNPGETICIVAEAKLDLFGRFL